MLKLNRVEKLIIGSYLIDLKNLKEEYNKLVEEKYKLTLNTDFDLICSGLQTDIRDMKRNIEALNITTKN
jgi:septation ring formation regulator EzrA